jgi:hypothetical protein
VIAYTFLALGCGGTAAVVYAVAPAGRGLHRYVVPRSKLRAEAARLENEVEDLTSRLVAVGAELEAVTGQRDEALSRAGKAEQIAVDSERDAQRLREETGVLKARLANLTAVRPLTSVKALVPPASPTPSSVVVPLRTALTPRPAAEPS